MLALGCNALPERVGRTRHQPDIGVRFRMVPRYVVILLMVSLESRVACAQLSASPEASAAQIEEHARTLIDLGLSQGLRERARGGDLEAQFLLGGVYARGEGVPQDAEEAIFWWRKAADGGSAEAQNELGAAYAEGLGVKADPRMAVEWFQQAAQQGLAVALVNLGNAYWNGTGVHRNERRAVELYRPAAEQGSGWAQFYLGEAYATGRGVRMDKRRALDWYKKSAEQGYVDAQYRLGAAYRANRTTRLAIQGDQSREAYGEYWLALAASNGHVQAVNELEAIVERARRTVQLPASIAIRSQPERNSAIIRHAREGELAIVVPGPDAAVPPPRDWIPVYLPGGNTMGFVSREELSGG